MTRASSRQQITERDVITAVRQWLKLKGYYVIRFHQGLGCHRGLADLGAVKNGKTVWIETKRPGGKLSADQEAFKAAIEAHGGTYLVVSDIRQLEEFEGDPVLFGT
ncbi:MAG: hypothetical protein WC364_04855 [Eubacteriales bacterium]|jgi:Holliday junction resolvase